MIDTSPAIAKSKSKTLYIRRNGLITIISDGKNAEGKWHIIDMAFGDSTQVIQDLSGQGYELKKF